MTRRIVKPVILPLVISLCCLLVYPGTLLSAQDEVRQTDEIEQAEEAPQIAEEAPQIEQAPQVKELNIVFLHGAGGNNCSFQLIEDYIRSQIHRYSAAYELENPGTRIQVNTLKRCYPGYQDIDTWAGNIAASINEYFPGKDNLILIGHSMGGKTALYTVAENISGMADKVAMVTTITSPVKGLSRYFVTGGGSVYDYLQAMWHMLDQGVSTSVAFHDSTGDGKWVSANKQWLAFISAETAPLSRQFDISAVDPWPRDMDDGLVPLSAQYAEGADVIYYGDYGHSDFANIQEAAEYIGDRLLRYVFGDYIDFSTFSRGGTFNHKADWLLGTDQWQDVVGGIPVSSDTIVHKNDSWFEWQEWEDIVGESPAGAIRDNYYVSRVSDPALSGIRDVRWLNSDNTADCRLYIKTRAAPRSTVQVNVSIYQQGLLRPGIKRDYYEVKIVSGTPFTSIKDVSWETDNPQDLRIRISSEAQSPFRWFKVEWRVYSTESRYRNIVKEIFGNTGSDD